MNNKEEIYQVKTIEAAVNTIMTRMDDLRNASEEEQNILRRRWIWELIQNASDCMGENEVIVYIEHGENQLTFSHNGVPFTFSNLIDLITQISSKRGSDEKIGKFGTGFISTHLISEIVTIQGIYHQYDDSNEYKKLDFEIDRSGKTEEAVKESVKSSLQILDEIEHSDTILYDKDKKTYSTSFIYNLKESGGKSVREAIKTGCRDLDRTAPFVFAFVGKIQKIICNSAYYKVDRIEKLDEYLEIINIGKYENDKWIGQKNVLVCRDHAEGVSIAIYIRKSDKRYSIESITDIPKLFCSFPLIGTENFAFPVVINCSDFQVARERNCILEGSEANKKIIDVALNLYGHMLDYVRKEKWGKIHNLCKLIEEGKSQFQKNIISNVKCVYKNMPIVESIQYDNVLLWNSLWIKDEKKEVEGILIPYMEEEKFSDRLWELMHQLKIKPLPIKADYLKWGEVSKENRISFKRFYEALIREKCIEDLERWVINRSQIYLWLKDFYDLWIDSCKEDSFMNSGLVPNQNNKFANIRRLYIDNNIDDELKDILEVLGIDIREKLVHRSIKLSIEKQIPVQTEEQIAGYICNEVRKLLMTENKENGLRTDETQNIFNRLTDWFFKNQSKAKQLFGDIYEKQHILTKPEETIRRLELANSVENAMQKNNIVFEQLEIIMSESGKLLQMHEKGELELTGDLKDLLVQISSKSPYAKERLEYLKKRSIESVYNELSQNSNYQVADTLGEWYNDSFSATVFPAKKNGRDMRIIIRPSDDDKIIFFEDAELEALDDTDYELWTDNESHNVRIVTLGDLIKTTGITKIPLHRIV